MPIGSRTAMIASSVMKRSEYAPLTRVERVGDAVLDGDLLADRDEVDEHLGVGVALEDRAARLELGAELFGVREVAVVADRERAARVVDGDGLRVLDVRAAGRRVAHVADGDAPGELARAAPA